MQEIGIGAGLGALGFWGFVAIVVVATIWDGVRKREVHHETLRRMIESGQTIDHALFDKLLSSDRSGSKNLARDLNYSGLIVLFIAPGLAILGAFVGVFLPLLGVAALVACVGGGLLVAARAIRRSEHEDNAQPDNPPAD